MVSPWNLRRISQLNLFPCCRSTNKDQSKAFNGTPKGGEKKEVTQQVVEMRLINLDASLGGSISGVPLTEGKEN